MCRDQLGSNKQLAGYLTPVPENSVVYGSGSSSVILTKVPGAEPCRDGQELKQLIHSWQHLLAKSSSLQWSHHVGVAPRTDMR